MKQSTSTFLPDPVSARSIVNSVTEDEDEFGYNYNYQNVWKEHARPKDDFHLAPLPPAHFFSLSSMGVNPQPFHQNSVLPPFHGTTTQTPMMPLSREPVLMDAQAFLTRYERMISEQEIELSSTISHLQPLFELLEHLNKPPEFGVGGLAPCKRVNLSKDFAIQDLQRALRILEEHDGYETVKTDKQFMMTLRTICEPEAEAVVSTDETISLGEMLQCYRMCIIGMQTLELLPSGIVRNRAKDRTLRILSMFRPSSSPTSIHLSANSKTKFSTLYDFDNETRVPLQRPSASTLVLSFIAGALAVLAFYMFVVPSALPSSEPDHLPLFQKVGAMLPQAMEMKQKKTLGKEVSHPLHSSRPSNCFSLQRSLTLPVLTPIESLRSNQTLLVLRPPLPSASDLSKQASKQIIVDERTASTVKKESLFNPEAVVKLLGTTAGLYLLFPIVTASQSWLAVGVTFLLASLGGQTVREWVWSVKSKFVRPKRHEG